ncbi:chitin synthase chs-2-like isoform X3 [Bombina bombina]|uniref:chitin synthase chs-2-like isoform X2 n=1 Tax=Bombina bombina TaxID=8345 RepID=UPI00235AD5FA|nr:chitin synthase chs-2-like isoform X2 [Bombina bombina]XP_053567034.1 chitin synthase chs-2-like isoform X3 [Bombina bombina]
MAYNRDTTREDEDKFSRSWDPFLVKPVFDEEEKTSKFVIGLIKIICTIVGLLVLISGALSKASLLLLIMMNGDYSLHVSNKPLAAIIIGAVLVAPNVLTLLKSLWKVSFTTSSCPPRKDLFMVCLTQSLVALGTSMLILVAMPHFNIISNIMILNSVCLIPSFFQIIDHVKRPTWKLTIPILSVVFLIAGYIMFFIGYINMNLPNIYIYIIIALIAAFLISINWVKFVTDIFDQKNDCKNMLYIFSSLVRILVTAVFVGSYIPIIGEDWSKIKLATAKELHLVISLFCIQAGTSVICHWFGVVACKMHSVRRSFALPLVTTPIAVIIAVFCIFFTSEAAKQSTGGTGYLNISVLYNKIKVNDSLSVAQNLFMEVSNNLCQTLSFSSVSNLVIIGLAALCWYIGFILCTSNVWKLKLQRIERTTQLFILRLYEAAFVDQSMLLNVRTQPIETEQNEDNRRSQDKVMIYLCATMWHETFDEMLKIMTSLFRLDKYKALKNKEAFDFEAHIYFDDAFTDVSEDQTGKKTRSVNSYVECLVSVIEEVYTVFTFDKREELSKKNTTYVVQQKIIATPYGGRLCYTLPHGNFLYVHLKDKHRIRHKKRWSQIMYMYYLLGWKLYRKYLNLSDKSELEKAKSNTYILALDGDTDFQPSALLLLVDRLKMYEKVGAACGRIHPTGTGPMVWYQKFEYAMGHWLQKSSEHVFGCVLCSPGCFSLFRASALMDDNVLKKYTTKATEASQYVQYDQGEDRWLCTLLLQQGWRVEYNAASDAYTNAPQEFEEFYNQRRRWGPSTMANTLELLNNGREAVKKNASISTPYIIYQIFTMTSSILGPATVCLMIAGSFSFLFQWNANVSLILAITPPAMYIGVCYLTSTKTQINIAAVLSVLYAFLMTATFLCIIGDMVKQETFVTPTGIFLISMASIYIVTALVHPQEFHLLIYGLMYIICVPSGYLLLTIYSLVNMHIVSWGTRETAKPKEKNKEENKKVRYRKNFKCLCWDIEISVNEKNAKENSQKQEQKDNLQPLTIQSQEYENDIEQGSHTNENDVAQEAYEERWIQQLQSKSRYNVLNEEQLMEEEVPFWKTLIKDYLEPLNEDKKKQEQIAEDLKSLRNKVTFVFFMINLLWIVATFFLQIIGSSITIKIPKVFVNGTISDLETLPVEPIGFMFLISFAILILLQFGALLYHRIYTLIHFIAYQETEGMINREAFGDENKYKEMSNGINENQNIYENPIVIIAENETGQSAIPSLEMHLVTS